MCAAGRTHYRPAEIADLEISFLQVLEAPPWFVLDVAGQVNLAVLRDDGAALIDQDRGVEAARAAALLQQFRITEIKSDADRAGDIEQALRLRSGQRALKKYVDVILVFEVPAREERRQRELREHDQIATMSCCLVQQRDQAIDDLRSRIGAGDRSELRRADRDDPTHSSSGHQAVNSSSVCSNTSAPAARCAGSVCSAGLWLMPLTDGTKIIAVGQMRAIICASCPAPDVIGRHEWPSLCAVRAISAATSLSKMTGAKRASEWVSIFTPSSRLNCARKSASRCSACTRIVSSVLRRSTVTRARAAMTLIRFGCNVIEPTVPTWLPPNSRAMRRANVPISAAQYPAS